MRVGLTGGIASGKTSVAELFAQRGAVVIDTDQISRDVVAPGQPALERIVSTFGPEVLAPDGTLDRRRMRALVFMDLTDGRQRLEEILHPVILEEMERRSAAAGGPYQILVIPLLLEKKLTHRVDRVLVVDAPEATRVARLVARDRIVEAQAYAMLSVQASREQRVAAADDVITNDADPAALVPQVDRLHAKYLALAAASGWRPRPPR